MDIIDAYEKVKPNLDVHAKGYPDPDYLRSITFCGIAEYGKKLGVGFGDEKYNDNPGVNHIIQVIDKKDDRPVWFGLWGGCNTLAQAVWKVWKTRSETEFDKFIRKIRVYGISDQDKGGIWMRENFGDRLFYIVSPSAGNYPGAAAFMHATWQGISFDYFGGRKVPNGLSDMEHPDWGGWGGRYEYYRPEKAPIFGKKEKYPIWTNADDTIEIGNGQTTTGNHATIWRWREAFQNDFLCRLRWTEESENPNGYGLKFHWFNYKEAGTYSEVVRIENNDRAEVSFIAPRKSGELHM